MESLLLARNPTITSQRLSRGRQSLVEKLYFQGQLRATGGSITQKCPLDRARLKAPIMAEEFQIPRISRSLAQRNEVFSAPTRLQRFLFSPRLQQQLSFKAQTPALHPDPLQPTEAKQTHSDVRAAELAPRFAVLPAGRAGSGEMLPATQPPHPLLPLPQPPRAAHRWGTGVLEMGSPRLPRTRGHHRPVAAPAACPGTSTGAVPCPRPPT